MPKPTSSVPSLPTLIQEFRASVSADVECAKKAYQELKDEVRLLPKSSKTVTELALKEVQTRQKVWQTLVKKERSLGKDITSLAPKTPLYKEFLQFMREKNTDVFEKQLPELGKKIQDVMQARVRSHPTEVFVSESLWLKAISDALHIKAFKTQTLADHYKYFSLVTKAVQAVRDLVEAGPYSNKLPESPLPCTGAAGPEIKGVRQEVIRVLASMDRHDFELEMMAMFCGDASDMLMVNECLAKGDYKKAENKGWDMDTAARDNFPFELSGLAERLEAREMRAQKTPKPSVAVGTKKRQPK